MWEPFVTASRRRKKDISYGARPRFVGEEDRISDMRTARPVSVERSSRWAKNRWVVKRTGGCGVAIFASSEGIESYGWPSSIAYVFIVCIYTFSTDIGCHSNDLRGDSGYFCPCAQSAAEGRIYQITVLFTLFTVCGGMYSL